MTNTDLHSDPFLMDLDGLRSLASEPVVQRGMTYFKEHRVTDLELRDDVLQANVEGSDPDRPYATSIETDEEGEVHVDCSCPFDWEPVCKHAVAALLSYEARQPIREGQVQGAADEARAERVRTGRTQVKVEHVSGAPEFGTWVARSVTPTGGIPREYRVQIRSVEEPLNRCSCPDFASNELGTCKHIEAVLHRLRGRRKRASSTGKRLSRTVAVVHLDHDAPGTPRIRVRRPPEMGATLARLLDRHFDGDGLLRGELPAALRRFQMDAGAESTVDIGDDALEHAARIGERVVHRQRAAEVQGVMRQSGGQLPGLRARLYPYQVQGVSFLAATGRALLADDMGLGKTLQAIAAAMLLRQREGVERVLVVCPASLKHQWAREIHRFTDLGVEVIQGGVRARKAQYRGRRAFTVVNYELVLRDHGVIAETLAPDVLVLDEAQRIKNWRTKTATAVKRLDTRFAFVLSGTPLENRLDDLYSVMQVVDPRVLGPLWRYQLEFHVSDEKGKVLGYRNLSQLRKRLAPAMLRRDRSLVADQLPPRVDQRLDVAMTSTQWDIHDAAMKAAKTLAQIQARRPLTPSEEHRLLAALQTARMACDAAGLVDGITEGSPKLSELQRLLEELCLEGGHKVVVFSQWERMSRMAEEVSRRLDLGSVRLHGGIPTPKRGALISRFEQDPGCQVFHSTDAGGVGLNLQAADVVINLDVPFNPAVLDQRVGRIHRLGQKRSTQAILLVAAQGYEERVLGLVSSKRELFANVISGEGDEDVIGLSKRAVEAAMATLQEDDADVAADEQELAEAGTGAMDVEPPVEEADLAQAGDGDGDVAPDAGRSPEQRRPESGAVSRAVERLQRELGERLQRVLVAATGIVAVVDAVSSETHDLAAQLSDEVPLAIVDAPTLAALKRLGLGGAGDGAAEVYRRAADTPPPVHPLRQAAQRKLQAAEVLAHQQCCGEAASLLAQAMLASVALRADLDDAPDTTTAAVWLFGEAVPGGHVCPEDAALVLRADALSRSTDMPPHLVDELLAGARRLVLGE